MATGDRRMGPARRGMTVLGKIPAAPKPINLPSQRLENRGLDPNVEIVPRGTLSWGSTGRSPPTGGSAWGNTGLSSSPPVSTGAWTNAAKLQTGSVSGKGAGGVVETSTRPSSAGSGQRPSSAPLTTGGAWNTAAKAEEQLQPSRFALTPVDFPTLGSEKNPDLRPQQNSTSSGRPASADGTLLDKERRPLTVPNPGQNFSASHYTASSDSGRPASADGTLLDKERRPFTIHPGLDGYGRSGPGTGGYGRPGDNYGTYPPFMQQRVPPPGNRGFPLGPGMYPGPLQHGGYYGSPGAPQYGTMEDRDMLMLGMVGNSGIYGHYPPPQGPPEQFARPGMYASYVSHTGPPDHFGRHSYGALGPGHRPPGMSTILTREQTEGVGYERDGHGGPVREFGKHRDGWVNGNSRDGVRIVVRRETSDSGLPTSVSGTVSDVQKHTTRAILGRRQPGQSDWGAVSTGDEPMDFSKPAFKEEALSRVSVSEDTKPSNILLKNKISQSQASRTELLIREGSKQQPTDGTNKPIEGSRGSEGGYIGGSLTASASGVPSVKVNRESTKDGKEGEFHGDLMGETNEVGKVTERKPSKETNEAVKVKVLIDIKNMNVVDMAEDTSGKKESILSQSLADDNRDKVVSPLAISYKDDNLSSKIATAVSNTKGAEVEPQTLGKSMVVGSESPFSSSCAGAGSLMEASTSTHDKMSTNVSSRVKVNHNTSDSECDKKNDKKGINDVSSDGHPSTDLGVDPIHNMDMSKDTAPEDLDLRVDHKPKVRMNSHEGEKEWRPKLLTVDRKPSLKPAGKSGPQSRKTLGVPHISTSGLESKNILEKGTSEQDNLQAFDLYDYEGQRAKLRETAAQRAIQRQKEEEERLKEQKAKALAKLEELNRRTSVTANSLEFSGSDESSKAISKAESEVEQQSVAESVTQLEPQVVDVPGAHGLVEGSGHVKYEQGKRSWERKRPLGSREEFRLKTNGGGQKVIPIEKGNSLQDAPNTLTTIPLTPASSASQALLPAPAPTQLPHQQNVISQTVSQTQQHVPGRSHVRPRNKQYISQARQRSDIKDEESSSLAPVVGALEGSGGSDNRAENPISSLVSPADLAGNVTSSSGIHEGAAALRKKKHIRNGKGRHRMEGSSVAIESSTITEPAFSDLSSGDMSGDGISHGKVSCGGTTDGGEWVAQSISSAVGSAPVQVSIHGFIVPDLGKDISFGSFHEDDYAELGLTRQNDESPSKKIQRKSHPVKQSSRDRPLQDVRLKDKQHTTEGMVWARVRNVESSVNTVSESSNKTDIHGEKVEELRERGEGTSSQSSARLKRDEIERYNPKSVGKHQMQLQAAASSHQGQRQAHATEMPLPEEQAVPVHRLEMQQSTGMLASTDAKHGIENRASEGMRPGRSHASWRQRNLENHIAKEASHNAINDMGGNLLVPVNEPEATSAAAGPQSSSLHKVKNSGGQMNRTASGMPSKHRSHPREFERDQLAAQSSELESQNKADLSSKETVHDIQTRQDNTSVRPARIKSFRQQPRHGKADVEPSVSTENLQMKEALVTSTVTKHESAVGNSEGEKTHFQERELNRRPHSAGANNPRLQGRHDDKEQPSHSAGSQVNQKSGPIWQSKPFTDVAYREKERQTVQTQQMPNQLHRVQNFGAKESHAHDNVAKKPKPPLSLGQNQWCLEEGERPSNQTQQMTDVPHRVQNMGGKEANLHDNPSKQQKSNLAVGQQVKPAHLLEESSSGQAVSIPQQQSRSSHANKQAVEREYLKDLGGSASHHSKKHGLGHLEWQQAGSSSNEKPMLTFGATGLSHNRKQQMSVSKTAEFVPAEQTALQSSRPVSAKSSSSSGDNQKINSQLNYQPVSQPSQGFKSFEQVEARPEGEPISRQPDRRDSSYTRVRDNWPSRRGRFNGRVRAADLDRRGEYFPKQRLVIDATGGETQSPVVG